MSNATRSFKKKSTGIKPVIRVHQWLTKVFSHELTLIPLISSIYLFPFSIIPHATGFLVAPWFWVVVDLISPQTPQAHHRARHYRACGVRRELRVKVTSSPRSLCHGGKQMQPEAIKKCRRVAVGLPRRHGKSPNFPDVRNRRSRDETLIDNKLLIVKRICERECGKWGVGVSVVKKGFRNPLA